MAESLQVHATDDFHMLTALNGISISFKPPSPSIWGGQIFTIIHIIVKREQDKCAAIFLAFRGAPAGSPH